MTLLFFDSFDHYTSNADMLKKWDGPEFQSASFFSVGSTDGRNGTNGGHWSNNSYIGKYLSSNPVTVFIGFAINWTSGGTGTILGIADGSGTVLGNTHLTFQQNAGTIRVFRGLSSGTLLGTSSSISSGQGYMEIQAKIDDTTGVVEIKYNGVSILSLSGIDTRNGGTARASQICPGALGGGVFGIDDLYICDDQGSTNNTYLGDVRAVALFPTGAGNHTDWTPSTGSNWQNVDDTPANGDTDYNSSSTPNQIDTFAMGDLPTGSSTVHGVQYLNYARKDDAGARSIAPVVRISGTDYVGTTASLGTSYTQQRELHETSPASSSAWTASEVNGLEYGYKEIS